MKRRSCELIGSIVSLPKYLCVMNAQNNSKRVSSCEVNRGEFCQHVFYTDLYRTKKQLAENIELFRLNYLIHWSLMIVATLLWLQNDSFQVQVPSFIDTSIAPLHVLTFGNPTGAHTMADQHRIRFHENDILMGRGGDNDCSALKLLVYLSPLKSQHFVLLQ